MSERILKQLGGGGDALKQVTDAAKNPDALKDVAGGAISNPLESMGSNIIIQQVTQPPGLYYAIGVAVFLTLIVVSLIWLGYSARQTSKRLQNLESGIMPQPQVNQMSQQVGGTQMAPQPQAQPQAQVNQFGMTADELEREMIPLKKRSMLHLIKTFVKGQPNLTAMEQQNYGYAPDPNFGVPNQQPMPDQYGQMPQQDPYYGNQVQPEYDPNQYYAPETNNSSMNGQHGEVPAQYYVDNGYNNQH